MPGRVRPGADSGSRPGRPGQRHDAGVHQQTTGYHCAGLGTAARSPAVTPGPDCAGRTGGRPLSPRGPLVSRSYRSAAADRGKRTCFTVLPDAGTPRFRYHSQSCNEDVGEPFFEGDLTADPAKRIAAKLAGSTGTLKRCARACAIVTFRVATPHITSAVPQPGVGSRLAHAIALICSAHPWRSRSPQPRIRRLRARSLRTSSLLNVMPFRHGLIQAVDLIWCGWSGPLSGEVPGCLR